MDKIVRKSLKVDFHIHSVFSKYKDEISLVGKNTIENIGSLVNKLNLNNIEMAAITDHDFFSYDMYSALKQYEGKSTIKKILPGVEFSVGFLDDAQKEKQVHVICLFDDKEQEKVKRIEKILETKNNKINYDNCNKMYFTEERFISLLNKINLNVVMIAHQKGSVNSKPNPNDLKVLGEVKFNEFLESEYFESLEFKSIKNGMFNNLFATVKNKNYDVVRFITGSDCHDWSVYPKHDSTEDESVDFHFTWLKCLPTFKGVAMALTDTSRIKLANSLFSNDEKKLDEIDIEINGIKHLIPMSHGINAIIGDNSIGKSMLIHKLTNYSYLDDPAKKQGYNNFLNKKNIKINTTVSFDRVYQFDYQGAIRNKFETVSVEKNNEFLKEKYPTSPDPELVKSLINSEFDRLYKCIETKFEYDTEYDKLMCLMMTNEAIDTKNISVSALTNSKNDISKLDKLVKYLNKIITAYGNISMQKINGLHDEDYDMLELHLEQIRTVKSKYSKILTSANRVYSIKTGIKLGISKFNEEIKKYKNELEQIGNAFDSDVELTAQTISRLVILKNKQIDFNFDSFEEKSVDVKESNYGNYKFVKRFKGFTDGIITSKYFDKVLTDVLLNGRKIQTSSITKKELLSIIKDKNSLQSLEPLEILKAKIEEHIVDDLTIESKILNKNNETRDSLSQGLNSTIYFDILSGDNKPGIYFIDQPEDDVSQTSIKRNLIDDFKIMSMNRQIILITHNPQFVVNLDVDNVINIYNNSGNIEIFSGALEYEDESGNGMLEKVANNLDGGIESIRKRWKRYDKRITF